ncbi:MAG: chorismate mutase [Salinispira sp.]
MKKYEQALRVWSVRGAVNLDAADKRQMISRITELLSDITGRNGIENSAIINIQFTQTEDIDFCNAAYAARVGGMRDIASAVPLFCSLEPTYPQSLSLTIRIMLSYYHSHDHCPEPVYLYETKNMRKDLLND